MITNLAEHPVSPDIAPILAYFNEITEIPRPSGKEQKIREYLIKFAQEHGFEFKVDATRNIAINVPASEGCEGKPRIILQGHMDMITEGSNRTKPTKAYIDGDWIMSDGQTTLGADNGIAIAMAMALATDKNAKHGPLTLLFTVQEETGLTGAKNLDPSIIPTDASILFNLDSEEESKYVCRGSAGGVDVTGEFDVSEKTKIPEGYQALQLSLTGLHGGHSGDNIHEERGNAIQVLNQFLLDVRTSIDSDVKLVEYAGGNLRNAIPSKSKCTIAVKNENVDAVRKLAKEYVTRLQTEGSKDLQLNTENAKDLKLGVRAIRKKERQPVESITDGIRDRIFNTVKEVCGLEMEATGGFKGGVLVSSSLGVADKPRDKKRRITNPNALLLQMLPRAANPEDLDRRVAKLTSILEGNGAAVKVDADKRYEGWLDAEDSPAVQLAMQALKETLDGVVPETFVYHAGLECSPLKKSILSSPVHRKDLSVAAVSIEIRNAHSNREKTRISSIVATNKAVRRMLELCLEMAA